MGRRIGPASSFFKPIIRLDVFWIGGSGFELRISFAVSIPMSAPFSSSRYDLIYRGSVMVNP